MWMTAFLLFVGIGLYFWDIGVDILVAREQSKKLLTKWAGESLLHFVDNLQHVKNTLKNTPLCSLREFAFQ